MDDDDFLEGRTEEELELIEYQRDQGVDDLEIDDMLEAWFE